MTACGVETLCSASSTCQDPFHFYSRNRRFYVLPGCERKSVMNEGGVDVHLFGNAEVCSNAFCRRHLHLGIFVSFYYINKNMEITNLAAGSEFLNEIFRL